MTISRILSSIGFFRPQINEKPQIKKDIKSDAAAPTWRLPNGRSVRLICNHETIECEVITGKKGSKIPIHFPEHFTPKEAIDRLREMHPILLDDHTVEFREREEKLRTWTLMDREPVRLIRIGEKLYYQTKFQAAGGKKQTFTKKNSHSKPLVSIKADCMGDAKVSSRFLYRIHLSHCI